MMKISLRPDADVLLVVDVQNDFCPGGALAVPGGDYIIPKINALMPRFRTVVGTQDWHPEGHESFASAHPGAEPFSTIEWRGGRRTLWPDHCIAGTPGADFHPALDLRPLRLVVRKGMNPQVDSYSAFMENDKRTPTGLAGALRELGARRVFLVGLATDFCVYYSAMDARAAGLEAVLVQDACRPIDLGGSLEAALVAMQGQGVRIAMFEDLA